MIGMVHVGVEDESKLFQSCDPHKANNDNPNHDTSSAKVLIAYYCASVSHVTQMVVAKEQRAYTQDHEPEAVSVALNCQSPLLNGHPTRSMFNC